MSLKDETTVTIGDIYIAVKPTRFTAVLGSCIAVCLWDSRSGIGGINHYLLPKSDKSIDLIEPKKMYSYGNVSIPAMIRQINGISQVNPKILVAKIYGGGMSPALDIHKNSGVSENNIEIAERLLKDAGITIVERDVGGTEGRKIVFDTKTGAVSVETIQMEFFKTGKS